MEMKNSFLQEKEKPQTYKTPIAPAMIEDEVGDVLRSNRRQKLVAKLIRKIKNLEKSLNKFRRKRFDHGLSTIDVYNFYQYESPPYIKYRKHQVHKSNGKLLNENILNFFGRFPVHIDFHLT